MSRIVLAAVIALAGAGFRATALADPGHEITIAELTEQIAVLPDAAELYYQRAWNYREIRETAAARADFEKALALKPDFLPASRELARMDADEGRVEDGIRRLQEALRASSDTSAFHQRGGSTVLASLLLQADRPAEALEIIGEAIRREPRPVPELCLVRSEAQRRLGLHDDRVRDLADAMKRLPAFVLRLAWLEALIDAGRGSEALADVEEEIEASRLRASWLIRRARIRRQMGDDAGAGRDLSEAESEIATRLKPESPDPSLLCDRGVIRALRGELQAAAADLAAARERGADDWMTRTLHSLLQPAPDRKAGTETARNGRHGPA